MLLYVSTLCLVLIYLLNSYYWDRLLYVAYITLNIIKLELKTIFLVFIMHDKLCFQSNMFIVRPTF